MVGPDPSSTTQHQFDHMNTILVAPPKPSLKGRILAIEPDAARARSLRDVLEAHVTGQVQIVTSTDAAVRAIDQHIPDVVLTSTFLTPSEEVRLTDHLKALPAASHVQVIITPHFIDAEEAPKTHVFGLRRNRSDRVRPACDHGTLIRQIGEYLQQARAQANLAARQELKRCCVRRPRCRCWLARRCASRAHGPRWKET